jgi:sugar O-acyltransferase (sialic acid O-acetyltransferase NeuD family)
MSDLGKEIVILGTGGFAHETVEVIKAQKSYQPIGFIENMDTSKTDGKIAGLQVYWIEQLPQFVERCVGICCLATTKRDRIIRQADEYGLSSAKIIHPSAVISESCQLEEGLLICQSVVVASNTVVGRHVRLNRGVLVGHDTHIGDYCTIQPAANIAGFSRLGEKVYVGMGATILEHIEIGAGSVIAAGAVVTRDVPPKTLVMGVPAHIVRENIENM